MSPLIDFGSTFSKNVYWDVWLMRIVLYIVIETCFWMANAEDLWLKVCGINVKIMLSHRTDKIIDLDTTT